MCSSDLMATIDELWRYRELFSAIRHRIPAGAQLVKFSSFATESELQELTRFFKVLQERVAAK